MVPHLLQSILRQSLDVLVVGLGRRPVGIGVQPQVGSPIVRLRVGPGPLLDLLLVHEDGVLVEIDPGVELGQRFVGVVAAHARVETIVPVVDPTNQVFAADRAVSEEGSAVQASAV